MGLAARRPLATPLSSACLPATDRTREKSRRTTSARPGVVGAGRSDDARALLALDTAERFAHLQDLSYLARLSNWVEVAVTLDDRAATDALRQRLLPYAAQTICTRTHLAGAVAHHLGLPDAARRDHRAAQAHLDTALTIHHASPPRSTSPAHISPWPKHSEPSRVSDRRTNPSRTPWRQGTSQPRWAATRHVPVLRRGSPTDPPRVDGTGRTRHVRRRSTESEDPRPASATGAADRPPPRGLHTSPGDNHPLDDDRPRPSRPERARSVTRSRSDCQPRFQLTRSSVRSP
jgi:hypothetical protein